MHPEDCLKVEELLKIKKFKDYNLILPEESKLITPYFRKVHMITDDSGFLLEIFSSSNTDWAEEESKLGPTVHCYNRTINPEKQAAGVAGHYHHKKKERFIVKEGAAICLIQEIIEESTKGNLEAILLHAYAPKLEVISENKRAKILKLPIMGITPFLAHRIINPLKYTTTDLVVLTQESYNPKDVDTYPASIV